MTEFVGLFRHSGSYQNVCPQVEDKSNGNATILHLLSCTMFCRISSFSSTMTQEIVCERAESEKFEVRETLLSYKSICMNLSERTKKLDAKNPNLSRHIGKATRQLELCKEQIESVLGDKNTDFSENLDTFLESGWARSLKGIKGIECLVQPYMHDWITISQDAERQLNNFCIDLNDLFVELYLVTNLLIPIDEVVVKLGCYCMAGSNRSHYARGRQRKSVSTTFVGAVVLLRLTCVINFA